MKHFATALALAYVLVAGSAFAENGSYMDQVEHHYVDNDGVKIHYAAAGEGPLIIFIHGFPDFWYSWHAQMEGLQDSYRVVAMDTRGYNESDKPEGQENYDMSLLLSDVAAVIKDQGRDSAVIVGHDWGGMIAWSFAMTMPQMTEQLVIVNLPHPVSISRELAAGGQQTQNSAYARMFQQPNSHENLSAQSLAAMVARGDADLRAKYQAAFEKSSLESMMFYYRQNFPREPYEEIPEGTLPNLQMPVLQFHGLDDTALLASGLNDTWNYMEKDYTLVTIPGVGHFAQQEAADLVTTTMRWWLASRR